MSLKELKKITAFSLTFFCFQISLQSMIYAPPAHQRSIPGHLYDEASILLRRLFSSCKKAPFFSDETDLAEFFDDDKKPPARSNSPVITWIGHSTFLIQVNGLNILTDPVLGDINRIYKRKVKPGIPLCDLPVIDIVLLSHNHCDHMDHKSLLWLRTYQPLVLVPKGDGKWFTKNRFEAVKEFDWDTEIKIATVTFSFLPARHWSGRGVLDLNKSLCGSWMISCNRTTIYFAGDSAYGNHYNYIAQKFPSIDVALMPISPNEPRKYTQHTHMNTQEAVQAFIDLNAKTFAPMHWGTFGLGTDTFGKPIVELKSAWEKSTREENENPLKNKTLLLPKFGAPIDF